MVSKLQKRSFTRDAAKLLAARLKEPRRFLQVVAGLRLVESAVGAHLANAAAAGECELFYWRDRNREVDFVVGSGCRLTAVEVKSARTRDAVSGLEAFSATFKPQRTLLVGGDGIAVEEFLSKPVRHWVGI